MLDSLYSAGVTELFVEVAKSARRAFPFPVRALHVDSTSFHVHGVYGSGKRARPIRGTSPWSSASPTATAGTTAQTSSRG